MFLHRRVELATNHDFGRGQRGVRVALPQVDAVADVARPLGVELDRSRAQRFFGRRQDGQVFIDDAHQSRRGRGRFGRLGDHRADLIALAAHEAVAEYLLVAADQAADVHRHIGGGDHVHHTGQSQGRCGVERTDEGVRPPGKDDLHVQHAVHGDIGGIGRAAGHLGPAIETLHGLTDNLQLRHDPPPAPRPEWRR